MLTVDYDRLDVRAGHTVLDLGCGEGRHAFEAYRRGATVVALDWGTSEVATTQTWLGAIDAAGEAPAGAVATAVRGDLLHLPVPDASVDRVMASEVLEHIPDDATAFAEIARVLKPGGVLAFADSVQPVDEPDLSRLLEAFPAYFHEPYYSTYAQADLPALFAAAGLSVAGQDQAFLTKALLLEKTL